MFDNFDAEFIPFESLAAQAVELRASIFEGGS